MLIQHILIAVLLIPASSRHTGSTEESGTVESDVWHFYSCYFEKYFKLAKDERSRGKEDFVEEIVKQSLARGETSLDKACVEWMCDENLIWKIWNMADDFESWAFYAEEGKSVRSWSSCFPLQNMDTDTGHYTSHLIGIV